MKNYFNENNGYRSKDKRSILASVIWKVIKIQYRCLLQIPLFSFSAPYAIQEYKASTICFLAITPPTSSCH